MIGVKTLNLANVRSHTSSHFEFSETTNAIVGPNGSGKTTIIEALYTLLQGSSFKGSVGELLQYSQNQFKVQVGLQSKSTEHTRTLHYLQTSETSQKKWGVDGKNYARLPAGQRLPVVLFEPDLARLITGSPQRRRQYLDQIAGQLDLDVLQAQNRYERTLKQRNQLLKTLQKQGRFDPPEELFVWNTQLAQLAGIVAKSRCDLLATLRKEVSKYYKELAGTDRVTLSYVSEVSDDPEVYASRLLQFLETSTPRDIALGHTSYGIHRDDMEVLLSDQPATTRASRGEVRTVVIALKLLETEIIAKHYEKQNLKPILLLDDVLGELDLVHQERVLAGFKDYQVFITTTDAHALSPDVNTIALD